MKIGICGEAKYWAALKQMGYDYAEGYFRAIALYSEEEFKDIQMCQRNAALCLEAQNYPNSVNCPAYPSTILKAGETYHEITVYKFGVK